MTNSDVAAGANHRAYGQYDENLVQRGKPKDDVFYGR